MALRGMLVQNADKENPAECADNSFEQPNGRKTVLESYGKEGRSVCPECGRKLLGSSRFCNYCGASLAGKRMARISEEKVSSASGSSTPVASAPASPPTARVSASSPAPAPVSATDSGMRGGVGANDLGALRSRYSCAYGILIGDPVFISIGVALMVWGIYMSQDPYVRFAAFFGYNPYDGIVIAGLFLVISFVIDFFIRKENCLEIYEYGVRGKGSVGLLGYRIKPFQFRYDEIVSVENKVFAVVPGICITAGNGDLRETHVFIRHANDAVEKIKSTGSV